MDGCSPWKQWQRKIQRVHRPITSNPRSAPSLPMKSGKEERTRVPHYVPIMMIGAAVWHENREKWLGVGGDHTQRSEEVLKDPITSWSTSYKDLLLTNEPFPERIPLAEMVDFLVDIWHMKGLFD